MSETDMDGARVLPQWAEPGGGARSGGGAEGGCVNDRLSGRP